MKIINQYKILEDIENIEEIETINKIYFCKTLNCFLKTIDYNGSCFSCPGLSDHKECILEGRCGFDFKFKKI